MAGVSVLQRYLRPAQDADWEESKHHRADNGRFASGSGGGKRSSENDGKGKAKQSAPSGGKRREMSEERASKFVREAFKSADRKLNGLKLSGHALEADTDKADDAACSAINVFLTKHGLRAKVVGESRFSIAEDGFDDIQVLDDPMLGVLVCLARICMLAKDLHYRCDGKAFYAVHRLADVICGVADLADDINEVYYMGELGDDPPETAFVSAKAAELVGKADGADALVKALVAACSDAAQAVEAAKSKGMSSATAAVLDETAKSALRYKGFLVRMSERNGAIDRVVGKGVYFKPDASAQDALTIKKDLAGRPVIA